MKTSISAKCKEPGCEKWAHFEYGTRQEAKEGFDYRQKWRCVRHNSKDKLLSPEKLSIEWTSEPSEKSDKVDGKYWGIRGMLSGDGFLAYADDFPEGTQIKVRVDVILPEAKQPHTPSSP